MRKIYLVFYLIGITFYCHAQTVLYNKGKRVMLVGNQNLFVNGNIINTNSASAPGTFVLDATGTSIEVKGNLENRNADATYFFEGNNGLIEFTGSSNQRIIGPNMAFHQVTVNNSGDTGLILQGNITVKNQLQLTQGNVYLNGSNIDLGNSGSLQNEDENHRVFGDSGYIRIEGGVPFGTFNNLGNLGISLSTLGNISAVDIFRTHQTWDITNGSIKRNYMLVSPTPDFVDSVQINYLNQEKNGQNASNLVLWYKRGARWLPLDGIADTNLKVVSSTGFYLDTIQITLSEKDCYTLPLITLQDSVDICSGDSTYLSVHHPNQYYQWSTGDTTESIIVKNGGSYSVMLSSDNGCKNIDSTEVYKRPNPVSAFTGDSVCQGLTTHFINNSSITSGLLTYQWDLGDGSNSVQTQPTHQYDTFGNFTVQLTATSTYDCSHQSQQTATVYANPTTNFSYEYNCEQIGLQLNNTSSILTADPLSHFWKFSDLTSSTDKNPTKLFSDTGNYFIQLITQSEKGCADTTSKQVTLYTIPSVNLGDVLTTCEGTYTLHAPAIQSNNVWSNTTSSDSLLITGDGTYWVTQTGMNGCVVSDTVEIALNTQLKPNLGADTSHCASLFLPSNFPNSRYLWSTGASSSEITIQNTGTYWLQVTDQNNCVGYDTIEVDIYPLPSIQISGDSVTCNHDSIHLDVVSDALDIVWSTNSTNTSIAVADSGIYVATATSLLGCVASDSQYVRSEIISVNLGEDRAICDNGSLRLTAPSAKEYKWIKNNELISAKAFVTAAETGTYSVTITGDLGCIASDSISITSSDSLVIASFLTISDLWEGDTVQFINLSSGIGNFSSSWFLDDSLLSTETNPTYTFNSSDSHQLTLVVDNEICLDSLTKVIQVRSGSLKYDWSDSSVFLNTFEGLLDARLFPNPAKDHITLTGTFQKETDYSITIINIEGKEVYSVTARAKDLQQIIPVHSFNKGLYILVIRNKSHLKNLLFIKT